MLIRIIDKVIAASEKIKSCSKISFDDLYQFLTEMRTEFFFTEGVFGMFYCIITHLNSYFIISDGFKDRKLDTLEQSMSLIVETFATPNRHSEGPSYAAAQILVHVFSKTNKYRSKLIH